MNSIKAYHTYAHIPAAALSEAGLFFPRWRDNDPHLCVRFLISTTATIAANYHLKDKAAVIEVSVSPAELRDDVSACAPGLALASRALFMCMRLIPSHKRGKKRSRQNGGVLMRRGMDEEKRQ